MIVARDRFMIDLLAVQSTSMSDTRMSKSTPGSAGICSPSHVARSIYRGFGQGNLMRVVGPDGSGGRDLRTDRDGCRVLLGILLHFMRSIVGFRPRV
jgi:hypothetical protein